MDDAGALTFALLGPFEARRDGVVVDLGGRQQRAVLAHLLLEVGRVVPVDRLILRLWGEEPPSTALGTLQSYVSRLRRALEPDRRPGAPASLLVSEAPGYALRVEREAVDVFRFESLAEEGRRAADAGDPATAVVRFDAALALWRGAALAGLAGEASVEPVVVRLEEGRVAVVEGRFEAELALARHANMIGALQEAVSEYPLRERLWGQLAVALYRGGRQADALRALSTARRTLADELGLEPGPDLQRLEGQILAQDPALDVPVPVAVAPAPPPGVAPPAPSPAPSRPAPVARQEPLLIGRRRERQQLTEALDAVAAGVSAVVLVDGEAGIGKSALLDELAAEARSRRWSTAWGRCVEGGMAPALWPWVEALRALLAERAGGADLAGAIGSAPLVAGLVEPASEQAAGAPSPFQLADEIGAVLTRAAAVVPVLMVLDDLHWADAASLELLPLVVARVDGAPVMVAGGLRPLDLGERGPLAAALGELARRPGVRRLSLEGVGVDDVAAMLQSSGVVPGDDVVRRVHARSGGNPFFVGELGRLLASEGGAATDAAVPTAVRDVVRRRLARLPERSLEVLAVAAVLGPDIDLRLLTAATGLAGDRCLDDLDPAVVTRLLVPGDGGRFRFGHALVRDAVLDDLSPLRRARLHQRSADAIEAIFGADLDHAEPVAAHRWAASAVDDPGKVAAAQLVGARAAGRRAAFDTAEQLTDRALDAARLLPMGEGRERHEVAALEYLAHLWTLVHGGPAGLDARFDEIAARTGSTTVRLLALFAHWSGPLNQGEPIAAEPYARAALDAAAAGGGLIHLVYGHHMWGVQTWLTGRVPEARASFDAALAARQELVGPDARRERMALMPMAIMLTSLAAMSHELVGSREESARLLGVLRDIVDALDAAGTTVTGAVMGAMTAAARHDAVEALRWIGPAVDPSAVEVAHYTGTGAVLGACARAVAAPDDAVVADALAGLAVLDAGPNRVNDTMMRSLAGEVLLVTDEPAAAAVLLEQAIADAERRGERYWLPEALRVLAAARRAAGAEPAAVAALLTRAVEVADAQGEVGFAERARADLAAEVDATDS